MEGLGAAFPALGRGARWRDRAWVLRKGRGAHRGPEVLERPVMRDGEREALGPSQARGSLFLRLSQEASKGLGMGVAKGERWVIAGSRRGFPRAWPGCASKGPAMG